MLPLECPYLNKTALFSVVGQQVIQIYFDNKFCQLIMIFVTSASSCKALYIET